MMAGNELLTAAEMSQADAMTAAGGVSVGELMQAAGRAVAEAALRLAPEGPIVVVAGRGNNGGDGFVAARILAEQGRKIVVALLCSRDTLTGDAAAAAHDWQGPLVPLAEAPLGQASLIIDALFGAGLNRAVKGDPREAIAAINASGARVLSIDLPSGINADTGAIMGDAVRATRTITFFRRKPGHLLLPGRVNCGPVEVAQIGISSEVLGAIAPRTRVNDLALWSAHFPVPRIDGHKYSRGHAVVVSGGVTSTGAARLAARGALRAGAGLVTVASPTEALLVHAAALTAIMLRKVESPDALGRLLEDKRLNSLVIGPGHGVGPRTRQMVHAAIAAGPRLVLDADALTSFAETPDELFAAIRKHRADVVLTPHTGEFSRLFTDLKTIAKLDAARSAAAAASAIVVLKGPDTVVAAPDGRAAIADNAPPWLATAGSGDVLAGLIGGLLAQGMPAFEAASAAVWLHGELGQAGGPGLIAEDLPDAIPGVYLRLFNRLARNSHHSTT